MSNKIACEQCHGTGDVVCETCEGEGKVTCPTCSGSGKSVSVCPDCHEGRVLDPRGVDDDDTTPCPTCHGNYKTENGTCKTCGGTGKVTCEDCDGGGKVPCRLCGRMGQIDADEFCSRYLGGSEPDLFVSWDDQEMSSAVFSQLVKIAESGHPEACYIVGSCYIGGLAVESGENDDESEDESSGDETASTFFGEKKTEIVSEDFDKAEKYLRMSSDKGMVSADMKLGLMYLDDPKDDARSRECVGLLSKAAAKNCAKAILPLAFFSLKGAFGCEKSTKNALEHFKKYAACTDENREPCGHALATAYVQYLAKAEDGDPSAMLEIAKAHANVCLSGTLGEISDLHNEWLEKAAESGNQEAVRQLAQDQKSSNLGRSIELLSKAAKDGDKAAKEQLKAIMLECTKKQARFDELKEIGNSGSVPTMKFIASIYKDGVVCKKDAETRDREATKWYEKAAETGDGESMLDLSARCRDGKGCEKDINRAFALAVDGFRKGGLKRRALRLLAEFYRWGYFAARDYGKAIVLYTRSANAGYAPAMIALGKCYVEGLGVKKDLGEAKRLFEMAVAKKSKDAELELKKLPADTKVGKKPASGVDGTPSKGPLPDFVLNDYEKAKAGSLWTQVFEEKRKAAKKSGKPITAASSKKRWKFVLVGLLFGVVGLHFLYARRKGWFFFYWLMIIANFAQTKVPAMADAVGKTPYFGLVAGLMLVGSIFFMKKDGNGNRM